MNINNNDLINATNIITNNSYRGDIKETSTICKKYKCQETMRNQKKD